MVGRTTEILPAQWHSEKWSCYYSWQDYRDSLSSMTFREAVMLLWLAGLQRFSQLNDIQRSNYVIMAGRTTEIVPPQWHSEKYWHYYGWQDYRDSPSSMTFREAGMLLWLAGQQRLFQLNDIQRGIDVIMAGRTTEILPAQWHSEKYWCYYGRQDYRDSPSSMTFREVVMLLWLAGLQRCHQLNDIQRCIDIIMAGKATEILPDQWHSEKEFIIVVVTTCIEVVMLLWYWEQHQTLHIDYIQRNSDQYPYSITVYTFTNKTLATKVRAIFAGHMVILAEQQKVVVHPT